MDVIANRGLSLRRKNTQKPKISAPRQISSPVSATTSGGQSLTPSTPLQVPRPSLPNNNSNSSLGSVQRQVSRENTQDYVKRRYSTRIPQLPKDFANGDTPAVPSIPSVHANANSVNGSAADPRRGPVTARGEKIPIDLDALEDPKLHHAQYVSKLLADASEVDIRDYQADLAKLRHRTSADIQHNVYKDRDQFIKISQEAEKLKAEMRSLQVLMSDLTTTLGQTNAALGIVTESAAESASVRRYANRSSVANLEAMWSTHLQELYRRVEGSQKFLPAIPGRHIIYESGRWIELNTATWKPRRRVHIILLNDHILIACEKKRNDQSLLSPQPNGNGAPNGSNGTSSNDPRSKAGATQILLYAERALPLQNVEISDLTAHSAGPSSAIGRPEPNAHTAHAINLRSGTDSYIFAAMDTDSREKVSLMAKYRKAIVDLRKAMAIDVEDAIPKFDSKRPLSVAALGQLQPRDPAVNKSQVLVDVDGTQQTFRMVEAIMDELDINIALQKFPESVEGVELLRRVGVNNKHNVLVQDLVEGKVQESANRLCKLLVRELTGSNSFLEKMKQSVSWLGRLGFEERAAEAYLKSRTEIIKSRISQCIDTGDLHQYLFQISYIYFHLIRNTITIHQACFGQSLSSACVKWATEHVEDFNLVLLQQLKTLPLDSGERKQCLATARDHADLLKEVGIDFRSLVGRNIVGFPQN